MWTKPRFLVKEILKDIISQYHHEPEKWTAYHSCHTPLSSEDDADLGLFSDAFWTLLGLYAVTLAYPS